MKKTLKIVENDSKGLSDNKLEILIKEFIFNDETVFETSNGSLAPIIFSSLLVKNNLNHKNYFIENSNHDIGSFDSKFNYLGKYCPRMTIIEDFLRIKRVHLKINNN